MIVLPERSRVALMALMAFVTLVVVVVVEEAAVVVVIPTGAERGREKRETQTGCDQWDTTVPARS